MTGVFGTNFPLSIWIVGWLLSAAAAVGNGVVVYLIATRQRLHNTANVFILSLAVADMCVGLSLFPVLTAREYLISSRVKGNKLFWLSWFFLYASAMNICVMATDRFMAITSPLKYINIMTTKLVGAMISAAWILPFVFVFPIVFLDENTENGRKAEKIFVTLDLLFFELLSCLVLVLATGRIMFIARRQKREAAALLNQVRFNQPTQRISIPNSRTNREGSAVKVLIAVVFLFLLCYVFAMCCSFCLVFGLCGPCNVLGETRFLFLVSNSAGNPVAYAFFKKDMKRELRRVFRRRAGTDPTTGDTYS